LPPLTTPHCVEASYVTGSWLQFWVYPHMSCSLIQLCKNFL